jgi:hypothetical protein
LIHIFISFKSYLLNACNSEFSLPSLELPLLVEKTNTMLTSKSMSDKDISPNLRENSTNGLTKRETPHKPNNSLEPSLKLLKRPNSEFQPTPTLFSDQPLRLSKTGLTLPLPQLPATLSNGTLASPPVETTAKLPLAAMFKVNTLLPQLSDNLPEELKMPGPLLVSNSLVSSLKLLNPKVKTLMLLEPIS